MWETRSLLSQVGIINTRTLWTRMLLSSRSLHVLNLTSASIFFSFGALLFMLISNTLILFSYFSFLAYFGKKKKNWPQSVFITLKVQRTILQKPVSCMIKLQIAGNLIYPFVSHLNFFFWISQSSLLLSVFSLYTKICPSISSLFLSVLKSWIMLNVKVLCNNLNTEDSQSQQT